MALTDDQLSDEAKRAAVDGLASAGLDPWAWLPRDNREKRLKRAIDYYNSRIREMGSLNTPQKIEGMLEMCIREALLNP